MTHSISGIYSSKVWCVARLQRISRFIFLRPRFQLVTENLELSVGRSPNSFTCKDSLIWPPPAALLISHPTPEDLAGVLLISCLGQQLVPSLPIVAAALGTCAAQNLTSRSHSTPSDTISFPPSLTSPRPCPDPVHPLPTSTHSASSTHSIHTPASSLWGLHPLITLPLPRLLLENLLPPDGAADLSQRNFLPGSLAPGQTHSSQAAWWPASSRRLLCLSDGCHTQACVSPSWSCFLTSPPHAPQSSSHLEAITK